MLSVSRHIPASAFAEQLRKSIHTEASMDT